MASENEKRDIAQREEATLRFWREHDIFKKTLAKNKDGERFVFYDGPPFATGLPHYGHILPGTIKDVIPRYQTMRGKLVRRKWGWDCHGLPVENLVEEELGLSEKKDIEALGIGKFNEAARKAVLRYDTEWKEIVPRTGRWVDMEDAYRTMDWQYTESIWWAFRELFSKGLIYEGYKSMHICPRCETTLAISEVTQGYKDITDISATVKFELADEPGTFLLAWTTTPWTLPGNVALAVNPEVLYVRIKINEEQFILAKNRLQDTVKDDYEILAEMKGNELVGKPYRPVFAYDENVQLENKENGWKVYAAGFVDTESGTGIVHIAPAFGEDDMALGKERDLPFIQHVGMNGRFKDEVKDFAGKPVKPKDNPQEADIEIIKNLAHRGLLFAKEKISHPYPHCWRCDTPLLNYAASSWFVKVTALKDRLIELNAAICWVPGYVGSARFSNWLSEARDWAVSRSRFWGAPLPVWKCAECEKVSVFGSLEEVTKSLPLSKNTYLVVRHGEADHNVLNVVSARADAPHHLTEKGKEEARRAAEKLKSKGVDLILTSPFVRTKETADIVADVLEISGANIIVDERLRELDAGDFDGKPAEEYGTYFSSQEEKFVKPTPNGGTLSDMKDRLGEFLYDTDARQEGKTIVIVTHEYGAWLLEAAAQGADAKEAVRMKEAHGKDFVVTGEVRELSFAPLPHDAHYELDLHRPFIDEIVLSCACGGHMHRVPEVFDCWFESGSMPYAQLHYPFENKELFKESFPADFIAEGLDQTRGWFYTMLVLAAGLFNETAYRNVIVNGLILAEDGQKMAKRLKNYPDPIQVIRTYGADALRYYLMSSPAVRAEPLNFSEKGVDEVYKKVLGRLFNVLSFYEMYAGESGMSEDVSSAHPLDAWILARLAFLGGKMTEAFDQYLLDKATREIGEFVDDLSTWYLRRSRERFKGEREDARTVRAVTRYILTELAKLVAPVMPFAAEEIYQRICRAKESVHLEEWPYFDEPDQKVLLTMNIVRKIVSLALEERANAGIKARQPLSSLTVTLGEKLSPEFLDLIKDEVNVKDIRQETGKELAVSLATAMTPELKKEGQAREFIRRVQDLRKKKGLLPADTLSLVVEGNDAGRDVLTAFEEDIRRVANAETLSFGNAPEGDDLSFEDLSLKVLLKVSK